MLRRQVGYLSSVGVYGDRAGERVTERGVPGLPAWRHTGSGAAFVQKACHEQWRHAQLSRD